MVEFRSRAHVALEEPDRVIAAICRHMTEHDAVVEMEQGSHVLRFSNASVRLFRQGGTVAIDVRAADMEGIYFARMAIASHIVEFSHDKVPQIAWQGDGDDLIRPPNFLVLQVRDIKDVTPHMRRLTLAGDNVSRFAALEALHVNVLVQRPELPEPQWPTVGADGLIKWADPDRRPDFRKYTVRSVNRAAGSIDIDFVRHADAGPGSALAERATVGDLVGITGPGGGGLVTADWYLFAGDETALPAIARMLEALPPTATGKTFIEVADSLEIQQLRFPPGVELNWLLRNGSPAGCTTLLPDAVAQTSLPRNGGTIYVWVACEYDAFRLIRADVKKRKLTKGEHLVVSYWRRDQDGSAPEI